MKQTSWFSPSPFSVSDFIIAILASQISPTGVLSHTAPPEYAQILPRLDWQTGKLPLRLNISPDMEPLLPCLLQECLCSSHPVSRSLPALLPPDVPGGLLLVSGTLELEMEPTIPGTALAICRAPRINRIYCKHNTLRKMYWRRISFEKFFISSNPCSSLKSSLDCLAD